MNITILKKLGLDDKEIKVYLALLEYGAVSIRSLAEISGLNRGTAYDVLKKLQKLGLASYYSAKTKQKFVAESPERLVEIAKKEEVEAVKVKKETESLVLDLKALAKKGSDQPTAKFYEGSTGIRSILSDLLLSLESKKDKDKIYYAYSAKDTSEDIKKAFPDFTVQRIKKGIAVHAISLAEGGGTHGLDQRRWLGGNDRSATFILLYVGKCAFLSRDELGQPVGVVIENRMIFQTQRMIFERLWEMLGR